MRIFVFIYIYAYTYTYVCVYIYGISSPDVFEICGVYTKAYTCTCIWAWEMSPNKWLFGLWFLATDVLFLGWLLSERSLSWRNKLQMMIDCNKYQYVVYQLGSHVAQMTNKWLTCFSYPPIQSILWCAFQLMLVKHHSCAPLIVCNSKIFTTWTCIVQ